MAPEHMLQCLFPTQDTYRQITEELLELFIQKGTQVPGRSEIEVEAVVRTLEERGHNRNTIYKVLREYLVPFGIVDWKKFEGSIQLSKRFSNAIRRFSISWNNFVKRVEQGEQRDLSTEEF